jgi:hypothetical protein
MPQSGLRSVARTGTYHPEGKRVGWFFPGATQVSL